MNDEPTKIEQNYETRAKHYIKNDEATQAAIKERDKLKESKQRMTEELYDLKAKEKELIEERDKLKSNIAGSNLIQGSTRISEIKRELETIAEVKEAVHRELSGSSEIQKKIDNANRVVVRCAGVAITEFEKLEQQKVDGFRLDLLTRLKAYDRAISNLRFSLGTSITSSLEFKHILDFEPYYIIPTRYRY